MTANPNNNDLVSWVMMMMGAPLNPAERVKADKIVPEIVAHELGMTVEDIFARRRFKELVRARQLIMWCLYVPVAHRTEQVGPGVPSTEIERWYGYDHATAIHAEKSIENQIRYYQDMRDTARRICIHLKRRGWDMPVKKFQRITGETGEWM